MEKYTKEDIEKFKSMLADMRNEAKKSNKYPSVDGELLNSINETFITLKVYNDVAKAISDLISNENFLKVMTGYDNWIELHKDKFRKSAKSLKHIFEKHKTPVPTDWEKIFFDWYFSKHPEYIETPLYLIPPLDEIEIFNWAKEFSENFTIEPPEKVEAYKNIPHILCVLDDLGILDIIDEKFSNKNYKGTAMQTDKAKLIATILGMDNAENIRATIRKKDYLTDKAKNNAVNTLKSLGLEPTKFID